MAEFSVRIVRDVGPFRAGEDVLVREGHDFEVVAQRVVEASPAAVLDLVAAGQAVLTPSAAPPSSSHRPASGLPPRGPLALVLG